MQIAQLTPGALVELRGGTVGRYDGRDPLTKKHRVSTYKDPSSKQAVHPRHAANRNDLTYTVWLIADDGRCRGDKADSPQDFMRREQAA